MMTENLTTTDQTCPAMGYQTAAVCVPITISPFATVGVTVTKCCGSAVVTPGRNTCTTGIKNGACNFTITQDICVAVPVEFGATATAGDTFVNCKNASANNICADCGITPPSVTP